MIVVPYVICGVLLIVIAVISRKNIRLNTKMMTLSEKNFQLNNRLISLQEEFKELKAEYEFTNYDYITGEIETGTDCDVKESSSGYSSSSNVFDYKDYIRYQRRMSYMSDDEINFGNIIRQVIPDKYVMFPQINLAAIILKYNTYNKKQTTYRNELFRNIDFGLFNRSTYKLELLIELNDQTHNYPERKERDEKVNRICISAGIKLITFWYDEDLGAASVQKKIHTAINCNSAYLLQDILN